MWLVLLVAVLPLAFFVPMMLTAGRTFQGGFWVRPSFGDIENTYRSILTLAFAPMLLAFVVWLLLPRGNWRDGVTPVPAAPLAERVLIGALALTPVYSVSLMMFGGLFVPRYVLFTVTGLAILWTTSLYRRTRGDAFVALVAIACLGGWFVLKYPSAARRQMAASGGAAFPKCVRLSDPTGRANRSPLATQSWMRAMEASNLPVVLSPAVFYLSTQYYSIPALRDRTYYLTSVPAALKYDGADTGDLGLLAFQRRFPVKAPDYIEFVSTHREFLVCAETTNPTWVLEKLLDDGAKTPTLAAGRNVFPVSRAATVANAMRTLLHLLARICMLLGGLMLLVTLAPPAWYIRWLAGPWEDPKGNVLIVLGGEGMDERMLGQNSYWRSVYAVWAWREGGFHHVVLSGMASVTSPMRDFLVAEGVPPEVVSMEQKSSSTHENAEFTTSLVRSWPGPYVLLTSDYHMRRAHGAFLHAGLRVLPRPLPDAGKRIVQWTARWQVFLDLLIETGKLGYYRARGWI